MHKNDYLAPKYQEMTHGLNITPEEDKTLRNLYNRATLPTKPWLYVFIGGLTANMVFALCSLTQYEKTHNKEIFTCLIAVMLAQVAGLIVKGYKLQQAEKQLRNKIDEIRKQNSR